MLANNLRRTLRGDTILNRAPGNVDAFQDGIHLDFRNNYHYTKAPGAAPNVSPLTSLFTFTGGNESMFMGRSGLLVPSVVNTPRIEYDANGNCLGLLIEAARTNLCLQSQTFDNAAWTNTQASVSANATTAPDGTLTADKITEDGTTNVHGNRVTTDITIVSNSTNTISIWAKAAERTQLLLKFSDAADSSGCTGVFDLSLGTASPGNYGTGSGAATTITAFPNGWYRCTLTGAINGAVVAARPRIRMFVSGSETYTGDGTSGLFIWGAQVEAAAFPSSYIPTTTASVARTADSCARTLGSEFSATAGTVVVAGRASGGQDAASGQSVFSFDDTSSLEVMRLLRPLASSIARFQTSDGGVTQCLLDGSFTSSAPFKAALAFAANDFALSVDGGVTLTDVAGTLPTVTVCQLGGNSGGTQMNGHILRFDYWPSRLSNGYLQQWSRL